MIIKSKNDRPQTAGAATSEKNQLETGWSATFGLIYLLFLTLDLVAPGVWYVAVLKVGGIALCLCYALLKKRKNTFLWLALAFTLVADVILAINSTAVAGVAVFCGAQFWHFVRLKKAKKREIAIYLGLVAIIFGAGMIFQAPLTVVVAAIYGITLITNLILAWWQYLRGKRQVERAEKQFRQKSVRTAVGFTLFLLCDLCVAGSYLSSVGMLPAEFYAVANYLAWVFYFPSQVLIATSAE